ncbi:MAG: hypothetical protein RLZ39_604 [Bacteroidota bacterium]|jgi:hypothetical protein
MLKDTIFDVDRRQVNKKGIRKNALSINNDLRKPE